MKYFKKCLSLAVLICLMAALFCGCGETKELTKTKSCIKVLYKTSIYAVEVRPDTLLEFNRKNTVTVGERRLEQITKIIEKNNFIEYDIHLMAVGDDLMHQGVINSGLQSDGSYNYDSLYSGIQPYLDFADIKVINQETIMAGNDKGFSGYPTFNSPTEMADSIHNVGFNVVTHATNHTDDMGISGLNYCKKYWDDNYPDIMVVGMYGEEGKNDDIPIIEINGVTFAMLNYTYGCNWATAQPNLEDHVELLTTFDPDTRYIDFNSLNPDVLDDIQRAEELADFVVVFPHWGVEYQTVENAYQDRVAAEMIDAGADIIIGTHPHVCQPVKWITTDSGNTGLCYFSLGNFLSSQYDAPTLIEGMAWVTIHVSYDELTIVPEETGVLPMVLHYVSPGNKITQTYAIEDYTEELALQHACTARSGVTLHLSYLESKSQEIFGDMAISVDTIMSGAEKSFTAVGATMIYNSENAGSSVGTIAASDSAAANENADEAVNEDANEAANEAAAEVQEAQPQETEEPQETESEEVEVKNPHNDGLEVIDWDDIY